MEKGRGLQINRGWNNSRDVRKYEEHGELCGLVS